MSFQYSCLAGTLLAGIAGCIDTSQPFDPLPSGGQHVLFIGNSLTYTNDLPGTVSEIAALGGETVRVRSVALPNFAVIDHALGQSDALAAIQREGWDYVVLQQGPTSQALFRDTLILATRQLNPYIRAAGARSAQLMTWPSSGQPSLFDAVRLSSRLAAEAVGGVMMPAGEAWRAALEADPSLPLYGPDGFHPSELGTYLVALVVYEAITGRDTRDLPPRAIAGGRNLTVPEATVRLLQRVAHETSAQFAIR